MSETYTIKNITQDLGFVIGMTSLYEADDDGFLIDRTTGERFIHTLGKDDPGKPIVLFKDPIPDEDCYVLNPYSEGGGTMSTSANLMYVTLRSATNVRINRIMMFAIEKLLEHKKLVESGDESHRLSSAVMRITAVPVDKNTIIYDAVDEKMVDEFKLLISRSSSNFLSIQYISHLMATRIVSDIFTDTQWEEKFAKNIRKKTLSVYRALFLGILGIKSVDELESFSAKYDATIRTNARFSTMLTTYFLIYSKFNDILPEVYAEDGPPVAEAAINLEELNDIIERMPSAYRLAKHIIQPNIPPRKLTDTSAVDTSGTRFKPPTTPMNRFAPQQPQQQGGRLPFKNDGEPTRIGRFTVDTAANNRMSLAQAPGYVPPNQGQFGGSSFGGPSFGGSSFGGGAVVDLSGGGMGGNRFGGGSQLDLSTPSNFGSPTTIRRSW